ncbi:hypothetical protein PspS34_08960 [Pseudomonas sp. S34]|uniref:hypothetical protein n=1 Tax=Pseudomonas sp. S34 TaxID=1573718 RepID=UPI00132F4BC7|nr:hypothetical protein [Pseudomonas sp. S34]QHF38388.1 hypothetical protein PspS34_08960 [Pseudomonas sp. S34]
MKKLLALALVTSLSLPLMAAETVPAATAKVPDASSNLSLSTPIAGGVTVGTGLAIGAGVIAAGVAASNSGGGGGNDGTPGTSGTGGTTGTTGTTR